MFTANGRCNQEKLIGQLKSGVHALSAPVDNLASNGAYMVMAALVILALNAGAEDVGGDITQDTTWTLANSPYVVTSTVYVKNGAVLTIEAGVEVRFTSNTSLVVGQGEAGTLAASGTAVKRILFTSNNTASPAKGDWHQIHLADSCTPDSLMEWCTVEYGGGLMNDQSVNVEGCSPTLRNIEVLDSSGNGINIYNASPTLETSIVQNVDFSGIKINSANPMIQYTGIDNAGQYGIHVLGTSAPDLGNLTITNPSDYGVYVYTSVASGSLANSLVENGIHFQYATAMSMTGNTFTNYDAYPTTLPAGLVGGFLASNTLQGIVPGSSELSVLEDTVTQSGVWPNNGLIYVLEGTCTVSGANSPVLTLEPGVELRFGSIAGLTVGGGSPSEPGGLVAKGSAVKLNHGRLRGSKGYLTSDNLAERMPSWYDFVTRERFYEETCRAMEEAVQDKKGSLARKAQREAVFRSLEKYGLITLTRGGQPRLECERERIL